MSPCHSVTLYETLGNNRLLNQGNLATLNWTPMGRLRAFDYLAKSRMPTQRTDAQGSPCSMFWHSYFQAFLAWKNTPQHPKLRHKKMPGQKKVARYLRFLWQGSSNFSVGLPHFCGVQWYIKFTTFRCPGSQILDIFHALVYKNHTLLTPR